MLGLTTLVAGALARREWERRALGLFQQRGDEWRAHESRAEGPSAGPLSMNSPRGANYSRIALRAADPREPGLRASTPMRRRTSSRCLSGYASTECKGTPRRCRTKARLPPHTPTQTSSTASYEWMRIHQDPPGWDGGAVEPASDPRSGGPRGEEGRREFRSRISGARRPAGASPTFAS